MALFSVRPSTHRDVLSLTVRIKRLFFSSSLSFNERVQSFIPRS